MAYKILKPKHIRRLDCIHISKFSIQGIIQKCSSMYTMNMLLKIDEPQRNLLNFAFTYIVPHIANFIINGCYRHILMQSFN
jgi:hypothetical protein